MAERRSRVAARQAVSAATEQAVGVLARTFPRVHIGQHSFRLVVFSTLDERVGEVGACIRGTRCGRVSQRELGTDPRIRGRVDDITATEVELRSQQVRQH